MRSDDPRLARWQDRLAGVNRTLGHGCNCNRDTLAAITAGKFEVAEVEHDRLPKGPPIVRPLIAGTAVPALPAALS